VAKVEGEQRGATGTPGSDEMKGIVDGAAGEVLLYRQLDGVTVVLGAERNQREIREDALLDDALDIGGVQSGLERQRDKRGEKLGEPVRGQMTLSRPSPHGLETWKGAGVMGMLLQESRDKNGSVETDFHRSKAADFCAAPGPLFFQDRFHIPSGWGHITGTDENPAFLGKGRCRSCWAQANAVRLNGHFQIIPRLQGKTIPDGFRHHNPAHPIKRDLHGYTFAISQGHCQFSQKVRLMCLMDLGLGRLMRPFLCLARPTVIPPACLTNLARR
jgi:hypothetical protein